MNERRLHTTYPQAIAMFHLLTKQKVESLLCSTTYDGAQRFADLLGHPFMAILLELRCKRLAARLHLYVHNNWKHPAIEKIDNQEDRPIHFIRARCVKTQSLLIPLSKAQ